MQRQTVIAMLWCFATAFIYAALLHFNQPISIEALFLFWAISGLAGTVGVWLTCPRNLTDSRPFWSTMMGVYVTTLYYGLLVGAPAVRSDLEVVNFFLAALVIGALTAVQTWHFWPKTSPTIRATCSCQS